MNCQVRIKAPDGTSVKARALLDSGFTSSFVSERIVQSLGIDRHSRHLTISGIGGVSHKTPISSISTFEISSLYKANAKYTITAIVVPCVTCDLPLQPVYETAKWDHLSNITLADPDFAVPGKIDLLLGADIYSDLLLHCRRCGPANTPTAFETQFGWVLMGKTKPYSASASHSVTSNHTTVTTAGDDILRMFWEVDENPKDNVNLTPEERTVVHHFEGNHTLSETGHCSTPKESAKQTTR